MSMMPRLPGDEPGIGAGIEFRMGIDDHLDWTVTTSYRFFDHWFTRFNRNRVMSNDSRDSDVFLLGVGYRWAAR